MPSAMPRLSWSHAAAGSILLVGAFLAACGGKQNPPPDPEITRGQYCQRAANAVCTCVGVAISACAEGVSFACLSGGDPNAMSGRTDSQAVACENALRNNCGGVTTGSIPPECPGVTPYVPGISPGN